MADLDVSDVLDDPDFAGTVTVTAREVQTDEGGLARAYSGTIAVSAVVIPDGGPDLVQVGEGDAVQGDITLYTRHPLTAGDAQRAADTVWWAGAPYTVIQAQPWLYGQGYTRAVCKLTTNNPSPIGLRTDGGFLG